MCRMRDRRCSSNEATFDGFAFAPLPAARFAEALLEELLDPWWMLPVLLLGRVLPVLLPLSMRGLGGAQRLLSCFSALSQYSFKRTCAEGWPDRYTGAL
mmetsp:Transcript_17049/g.40374  ORF Transcript_17049/g.40374 Transcript_17049/m.40374 type:complete len:99 (+) Transcript_17049:341-637(+)